MAAPKSRRRSPRRRPAVPRARKQARPKRTARRAGVKSRRAARKTTRVARSKPARKLVRAKPLRAKKSSRPVRRPKALVPPVPVASTSPRKHPAATLDRERRRLPDEERLEPAAATTERDARDRLSAKAGREELKAAIARHTEASPVLTAGDVDAKWEDAYAVGDEAPGGDNPTPDQDRVDDIGRALGVTYSDNEELRASDKVAERDRHRWELDPASSDDWPHDRDKG